MPTPPKPPRYPEAAEWLTVAEVGALLDVSATTVREWVAAGELAVVELGRRTHRIHRPDLDRFLEGRRRATDTGAVA